MNKILLQFYKWFNKSRYDFEMNPNETINGFKLDKKGTPRDKHGGIDGNWFWGMLNEKYYKEHPEERPTK